MAKKKKKNLKLNMSTLYITLAFMFILGFGFFGTSKLFMAEDIPLNQTELNEEFDLKANGNFTIKEWAYDKEQNMMEVTLITNGIEDYMTKLDFTAVSRERLSDELPTEIVYDESDIYIIHIKDVPKDFNQIALRFNKGKKSYDDLFAEGEAEEGKEKVISTVYTDQRVVKEEAIPDRNFTEYALEITGELITKAEQDINELEDKSGMTDDVIAEILKEIEQLQVDLLYQTVDEQVETNNDVFQLEKSIEGYEKEKEIMADDIKNIRAKVERLKQKQYDLNI
ncbi:hypothetical protein FQ085_14765 [Planococcus sp. ANT_H30]|uniref:hypothetical protein n=1 Tax=Planococcus sp. ANT_H30 TaxID=2597347 RepID=UPI0011EFC912|nr:hypothetical protein [Planococcus sp. ANT_H30]KAA0956104.1 hypothetical protein FQ085_14765 [Planococcus sp. ANT_H30]